MQKALPPSAVFLWDFRINIHVHVTEIGYRNR